MNARILVKAMALLGASMCAIAVFGEQVAPDGPSREVVRYTIMATQFPLAALMMLAAPALLFVGAFMLGYRPTTLFALAFAAYASIAALIVTGRTQFSGQGMDSPYTIAMVGFLSIMAMEVAAREPVTASASMASGPTLPPGSAPVGGRDARRG